MKPNKELAHTLTMLKTITILILYLAAVLAADEPKTELFALRVDPPAVLSQLVPQPFSPRYMVHVRDTTEQASEFRIVAVFDVDGKMEARVLTLPKVSNPNSAFTTGIITFKAGQKVRLMSATVDVVSIKRGAEIGEEAQ